MNKRIKKKQLKLRMINQSLLPPTMSRPYKLKNICPVKAYTLMQLDAAVKYFLRYKFSLKKRKRAIARYIIAHNNDPGVWHPYINYRDTMMVYGLYYMMMNERPESPVPPLFLPV